jgi:uncharacterized protein (TIGR02145 family)
MRNALAGLTVMALAACSGSTSDTSTTGDSATGGGATGTSGGASGTSGGTTTGASNTFTDPRDNQTYPTVVFGSQTWLGANLNYATPDGGASYCYGNESANCDADGRLYTYAAAQTVCPGGWHLASDSEWMTLETTLGMPQNALTISGENTARGTDQGTLLKDQGDGGFGAKASGYGTGVPPEFANLNTDGYFWTSTPDGSQVWRRHIATGSPYLYRFENPPVPFAISVRCLQDSSN